METNATHPKVMGSWPAPPGVTPNFVDPPNQTASLIAVHAVCLALVTCCVAVRLYTRQFITRRYGWDDFFCILAYALTIGFSSCQITANTHGYSRHLWDIPFTELARARKPFSIGAFVYNLLLGTIKLSCLFFYTNIFSPGTKTLRAVKLGIVFVAAAYLSIFFAVVFQCHPIQRTWDFTVPGHCYNAKPLTFVGAAVNIVSDLFVLMVPIPAVMSLPLELAHKLRVIGVFSLGLFACIISVVRVTMLFRSFNSIDFTWNTSRVGTWSIIEADVGLICSCLFVLPAFLKHHGISAGLASLISRLLPSSFTRQTRSTAATRSVQLAPNSWFSNSRNQSDDIHLCESVEHKPADYPNPRLSPSPPIP